MNDERLARRAAAGDRKAFGAIFKRYHQDLYRFCLATVGNPQDAQDALQNTMVKALRALHGEEREIKLKPWLYRIARNESVEILRRRRDDAELEPQQPARIPEIAETAAARERLRGLLVDLEELPERQRATLTMRELGGLDFAEIGAALQTSAAVARQTLYEARLSLRQMEAGREMDCEAVTQALSDADGRVTRRRDIRAHLRGCADCRAFRDGIAMRREGFAAIAPLPAALSGGLLSALLSEGVGTAGGAAVAAAGGATSGAAAGAGGIGGITAAAAGKVIATSTIVKSAVTVAVVATAGVTAADRGGVIDLPLTREEKKAASPASPAPRLGAPTPTSGREGSAPGEAAVGSAASAKGQAAGGAPTEGSGRSGTESAGGAGAPTESDSGETDTGGAPSGPAGAESPGPGPGGPPPETERSGPVAGLPPQSDHGQQTAKADKPPKAISIPGRGVGTDGIPPQRPVLPPKAEPSLPPVATPPIDPPPSLPGNIGSKVKEALPPVLPEP